MSKAIDDILAYLRDEALSMDQQAELIQRLRDGEGDRHKPDGEWLVQLGGNPIPIPSDSDTPSVQLWHEDADDESLKVTFYHGQMDGKPVIQIDGSADFRINVNDAPIWDQSTEAPDERRKVWVGTISDQDGVWVYVGATEEALFADMRSNYGEIEFRDESDHDWVKRAGNAGAIVNYDSFYVETEEGDGAA